MERSRIADMDLGTCESGREHGRNRELNKSHSLLYLNLTYKSSNRSNRSLLVTLELALSRSETATILFSSGYHTS
jgi:hypothetical protein